MAIPLTKAKGYLLENANDLSIIRVRAAQLNADTNCDRKFSVTLDYNTKVATITATLKEYKNDEHKTTGDPGGTLLDDRNGGPAGR